MYRFFFLLGIWLISFNIKAQDEHIKVIKDFITIPAINVHKPLFADVVNINGLVFKDANLLKYSYLQDHDFRPQEGDQLEWDNFKVLKWKKTSTNKDGILSIKRSNADFQIVYLAFYLQNNEWAKIEIDFQSSQMLEVYVDGEKQKGKYSFQKEGEEESLKIKANLEANNHVVLIKSLYSKEESSKWALSCSVKVKNEKNKVELISGLMPYEYMNINHLMNGVDISSAHISYAGDYYFINYKMTNQEGESQNITDVKRLSDGKTKQIFYGNSAYSFEWAPFDNVLTYTTQLGEKSWIWQYNLETGKRFPIATDLVDINGYTWSPNGEFLILSKSEKPKTNNSGLKKIEGMPDHWPWYRNRSNLIILDVLSGIQTPLTFGYLSNNVQDISPNGRYIMFSQTVYDLSQRPYSKQILMQYDKQKRKIDTVWNKFGDSRVQYSPDGKQLLVLAGPAFFGEVGINLTKAKIPNDYDKQAYLYQLNTKEVTAISKTFHPSISNAMWSPTNSDNIYFNVSDRTYIYEYVYSISKKKFHKIELDMDVVNSVDFAEGKPVMVYFGSSISTPKKAYKANIETGDKQLLSYPEENFFKNVKFGENEDWNFINNEGITIEGRLYFPPNFDATKKYPMIVYYYGGTSPTERNFRGRYPKNLFAANGYIVYVLQPSGATGYGQDFSAEHVNNWGQTVADEIIHGSRLLCQTHSFIDSTKVGCMGASYGGFMTMYLTTQTNFFSAAIAHAGISSISSYWGEGYWGYLYSEVASANSFPWNNKKLYVEQSPLFHADQVNTPLLLLHGNSDTNVPPGESRQFYTALKLLNKDVELIEIDKQNHHIVDYKKRILWQKTILAWFDKNLKGESDWWFHLYPNRKL